MKIEDLETAQSLVKKIEDYSELISRFSFEGGNEIEFYNTGHSVGYLMITVQSDHGCQLLAQEFIQKLKDYHTQKLQQATDELEAL